jgi:multimeric flavodoxin WrbA
MNIMMVNGNPNEQDMGFEQFVENLVQTLKDEPHHQVEYFIVRTMNIKPCKGCFGCWVKTPGECTRKDEGNVLSQTYMNVDLVIHASPILMGFLSALTKKVLDRNISILLPYFDLFDGEVHHRPRYNLQRYPDFAFLLQKESDTDNEDMTIIQTIIDRNVKNMKGQNRFIKTINDITIREVLNEINRL